MHENEPCFEIPRLGQCRVASPVKGVRFTDDTERVLLTSNLADITPCISEGHEPPQMEKAGPREHIYFDPSKLKCGIVTCGGLCPGLNDVIRAIVLSCHFHYGVKTVYGFPYGFEGLSAKYQHTPLELTPEMVKNIHEEGGSILASSRGPQDPEDMVDTLERMNVGILFTIGGDGTLKGAQAIVDEVAKRGLKIAVIGIPKTIDNDISFVQESFGFETACTEARSVITAANTEAEGARNGIGLVKLMGRDSGFISAFSTLANNDVNFCLIPEVPFSIEALCNALKERIHGRGHAVVVVAEGAGQELLEKSSQRDASGNVKYGDIGVFLKEHILASFKADGIELNLKYIDPSYTIRSRPSNAHDAAICLVFGHNAVHAGMSGRTGMMVSNWKGELTHVPLHLAVSKRKKIDSQGWLWRSVLSTTGQPAMLI